MRICFLASWCFGEGGGAQFWLGSVREGYAVQIVGFDAAVLWQCSGVVCEHDVHTCSELFWERYVFLPIIVLCCFSLWCFVAAVEVAVQAVSITRISYGVNMCCSLGWF